MQSEDHPDLWNSKAPKTNAACNERKKVRMEGDIAISTQLTVSGDDLEDDCFEVETTASDVDDNTKRKKRKKRLTPFDLSEIIVEKGILKDKSRVACLCKHAEIRREIGHCRISC